MIVILGLVILGLGQPAAGVAAMMTRQDARARVRSGNLRLEASHGWA